MTKELTDEEIKKATKELSYEAGIELNTKNPFKKLHYATDHLPFFHEFSSLTGLYGEHYLPVLKARYYQLIGGILQKKITLGELKTDTRMHVAYPIVTEGGKNELIYSIKALIKNGIKKSSGEKFTIANPTSFHPEQLIGKYIEVEEEFINEQTGKIRKRKIRVENRGHLNNDFVEFDECNLLITSNSPENQQAREHLSTSENPIGRNEVEKRLVEDLPENTVRYCPSCTNSYYFQPYKKLPEEVFLQGFLRRKLIPIGNIKSFLNFPTSELYSDKLESITFSEEEYQNRLINHLEAVRQLSGKIEFVFTEEAVKLINEYALYLSAQGQIHSKKIANYCKVTKYTTLSYLVKMAVIISASYYQQVVDKTAVCLAFMDLTEILQNTFNFIYERTLGDFSYGTTWGGASYKEQELLKHLFSEKAFSFETSGISIDQFVALCQSTFEVREDQARNNYLRMKKKELIDSRQYGQHDSRVWLKITPEEHTNYLEGDKGSKGWSAYNYVFSTKNEMLRALKPLQPSKPLIEKIR